MIISLSFLFFQLYELDWLYEMADQLGIMLWQDMNFACAMYPSDPVFLDNVATEVYQQVSDFHYERFEWLKKPFENKKVTCIYSRSALNDFHL